MRSYFVSLIVLTACGALGQPAPTFEVASVRLSPPYQPGNGAGVRLDAALFTSSGLGVRNLISIAFKVPLWRVSGGPAWLDSDGYDIRAALPPNTAEKDVNSMLLALLTDRFKLAIHREMTDYPIYALVVAKDGPKLKATTDDKLTVKIGRGHLEIHAAAMPIFISYLAIAHAADRPIVDFTGLTTRFDVALDWSPDTIQPDSADSRPSVFTAIQQLGLKLEPRSAPLEFIVIDHVERPSEN